MHTSLESFINESEERMYEEASVSDVIDTLVSYGWSFHGDNIFRGSRYFNDRPVWCAPGKGRRSRNTSNYYTLVMNEWPGFPKRELVCSTNENKANSYGDYLMTVVGGERRWGVCPADDVWESFEHSIKNAEGIRGFRFDDRNVDSYEDVEELNVWLRTSGCPDGDIGSFAAWVAKRNRTTVAEAMGLINSIWSPGTRFKVSPYNSAVEELNKEVWTDEDVLMLPKTWLLSVVDAKRRGGADAVAELLDVSEQQAKTLLTMF